MGNFQSNSSGSLSQSFFYRAHLIWNRLPISLREIIRPSTFKIELIKYLWKKDINDEYINHTFETINNHHGLSASNLNLTET